VYLVLADLSKTDFPEVLQEHYDWVMRQLTARESRFMGDNPAQASVFGKANKTLVKIAERIVYISDHWHSIVAAGEWPMASTDDEMEDRNG
jgi:hypothetical protein